MKLTPLILFLILLFVLILSILFSKFLPLSNMTEGFISFSQNKQPLDLVNIPIYSTNSTSVVKLNDNLFFDTKNANLIEVDGQVVVGNTVVGNTGNNVSGNAGNVDSMGVTINGIYVVKRDGTMNVTEYSKSVTAPESTITSVSSKYNNWTYTTQSSGTDKYQTLYFSWNDSTYIHIIDLSTKKHISSFAFGSGNTSSQFLWTSSNTVNAGNPASDSDSNNNTYITDGNYNATNTIYQISGTVRFDPKNGNIIIKNNPSMSGCTVASPLTVYNRTGAKITDYQTNYQTSVSSVNFAPWIQSDGANNMLVYMPIADKTLIFIIKYNSSNNQFSVANNNICRFNSQGLDTGNQPAVSSCSGNKDVSGNNGDDYQKWLAYWNTVVNANGNYSQDYLLKTQIIPPVCPSCPSCPNGGGACTSCGGLGGSGTQGAPVTGIAGTVGAVVAGGEDIAKTGAGVVNKTIDTTGNVLTSAGTGATKLVGGTIGTAANLATSAGSGTVGLLKDAGSGAKDVGSGAVGLLKDTASGAVGLVKDVGSEAKELLQDAGSGATKVLTQRDQRGQGNNTGQGNNMGQGNNQRTNTGQGGWIQPGAMQQGANGVDLYSGYGALQSKGSDFIPITSDFSSFGK